MAWAKNGTPNTLGSAGDTITISDLTSKTFNQNIAHIIGSGSVRNYLRMGNGSIDSGSNYASRYIDNGSGADNTSTSSTELQTGISFTTYTSTLDVYYAINISSEEKLLIGFNVHQRTAGATTAPDRVEWVGKWANTSNQYDQFQHYNNNTGDFDTNSNFSALTGDATEETILANLQSGSRFEATDTQKIYYGVLPSVTYEDDFTTNTGWSFQDTNKINIASNRLDYQAVADNTNDSASYDLGTVSDSAWVLRFHYSMTAQTRNTSGYEHFPSIGISDSDYTVAENTAQKGISFNPYQDNLVRPYTIAYADGHRLGGDFGGGNTRIAIFSETASVGDNYYIEIKRTSSTNAVASIYSDSNYSTLVESKSLTIPSTVTGLKYFVVKNANPQQNQSGSQTGWIDDVKFYNGVTSPTTFTWTEEA